MNTKKTVLLFAVLISFSLPAFSQLFEIGIPISVNEKDADANGYFNPHNNTFILEQQNKGIITRMLYDTSFNLQKKYTAPADSISFAVKQKKAVFLKEYCANGHVYEIYGNNKSIQVWELDFDNGLDKNVATLKLQDYYKNERTVAILPGENKVSFLTYNAKENKLLLYNYFSGKEILLQHEFVLPDQTLTKQEIKEKGKSLSLKYDNILYNFFVSHLNNPSNYQLSVDKQLLYNDSAIYMLINMPYNMGLHLLQLNRNNGSVSAKNFFINKINFEKYRLGSTFTKQLIATAYDSLLIVQNSNASILEYYLYSLNTKELLVKYEAEDNNSLSKLVHSDLRQIGTYGSKDEEKDLTNERRFLRRKNKGLLFIKAARVDNDSLLVTFGSFVDTEGIEGTLLSFATSSIGFYAFTPVGSFGLVPYLTLSRNKFLYAHSKFSLQTLQPSNATDITTHIDNIASDKRIDDIEKGSSFIIERNEKLYVGVFNKKKDKYEIFVY